MEETNTSASNSNSSSSSSRSKTNSSSDAGEEDRALRSQVCAVKPLMQSISSFYFRKHNLVILQNLLPEDASPTAPAHCIQVQHSLVPSQSRVGIASQELVTNNKTFQVPRIKYNSDIFNHVAEQDNGIIVAIEREDVRDEQEQEMRLTGPINMDDLLAFHRELAIRELRQKQHYVRYGVGAGTDGRDLKPRIQLPMFVTNFHRFCVWGPHVYIACCNYMGWINFSGDEPVADYISGLREVQNETCEEIFRHDQTIVVHGFGIRTPANTEVTDGLDIFEYVDIFSLAADGRPTHQDRFYLPRRPYSARVSSLTRLVGPDKEQLLLVTTDLYHHFSQIRLIPTAQLREEQHATEAAEAAPSLIIPAPSKFVIRDLDNGRQELLMPAHFQG